MPRDDMMITCQHAPLFKTQHLKWEHYRVELLCERLTGGLPAHEELLGAWMESRNAKPLTPPDVAARTSEPIDRVAAQEARVAELADDEEIARRHTVVFARDAGGLPAYEGRQFAGALKEAANILKKPFDVNNFRARLVERVFVCEHYASFPSEALSIEERTISVMTRQGPRTSIKRSEVATNVQIAFTLHVLADGIVKPTFLEQMVLYTCLNGLGADRSQGSGRCRMVDFVRVD